MDAGQDTVAEAGVAARNAALADLLARVALRDRKAFETLYRETARHLLGVVLRIVDERAAAEDVLQELFVEVWSKADRYRVDLAAPMTWLRMLAQRRAIDHRRRRTAAGAHRVDDDTDPDSLQGMSGSPESLSEDGLWNRHLNECLEELPEAQREVVVLIYVHGWTQQELVERQGSPLGTVKSWARRGLQALRACVERISDR
ncbi:sigma-70 family RNA polymerase sigma factor [Acidihalobacter ferrooxydans]|uniref:RNA polymerase subunit sigma-24 n=1 Tax=Acidihalobacter ferrooxydans TaxID=1765967 RepID=A0A1P8UEW2_9GAMM|nr:sigma-70 family RNA polymerase sigma factor [Acidihalobacter ferrooxydans]APZ42361.1 hypothetical protein BW247_04030 [Acidihalobacter ferrooxydans]